MQCTFNQNTIKSNSSCNYGYTGSYCDECGLAFNSPNVKIVGGIEAKIASWPSVVFIYFSYTFTYESAGRNYSHTSTNTCGGTLIDRQTVLTAASCYNDYVSYQDGVEDEQIIPVTPNSFHSTVESAYKVYLGLHNTVLVDIGTFESNEKEIGMDIKKFIRVFIWHPVF